MTHLWVFTRDGNCIFDYCFQEWCEDPDTALFAGFLNAIQSYSMSLEGGAALEKLALGKQTFHIHQSQNPNIFIVAEANLKKDKQVRKRLEEIEELFQKAYPPEFLESWNGDLHAFEDFQHKIEDNFVPVAMEKMKEGLWS